jgi:ATP-dependent helicase/nuclease subunit A
VGAEALPAWAETAAPVPDRPARPLSPSALGGAKARPGEGAELDEDAAKARGSRLHLLLEHLPGVPAAERATWAERLLPGAEDRAALLAEAVAVLEAPELAQVFAPGALAEVEIAAALPALDGARIAGVIDRLLVRSDQVLAVDFKSNAVVPARPEDVPEGLLRQMGAYAAALAPLYPGRKIGTALLWTRSATLMPLPAALTAAALERAAHEIGSGGTAA